MTLSPASPDIPGAPAPPRPHSPVLLLTLLALWLVATLGLRPLLLPDEGRYGEAARAMLGGDPLVPTLDGLPFFHKPPLFYWIDVAAMRAFGSGEFGARFGSALGAWLMGAALYLAMRRWHGPRTAAIGLGVLATTPFFYFGAQYANHDMLVGGLISAAVLALARALEDRTRIALRWLVAGWVLCALAMLAKGLIGVVLPALVIGPWLLAQGRWRQMFGLLHPLGLIAFGVVAAPWFVAMQLRYPGFFDYFFVEQHFRRFAQTNFNNARGAWFFLVALPLLTLPWGAWLPAAVRRVRARSDAFSGLLAWWVVAVIGFFSIPTSKLAGYALPAVAPWCALLALAVANPARPGRGRAWRWAMGGSALACVAIVAFVAWKAPRSDRALALHLASRMADTDKVVMVGHYFYDVPFYARLAKPQVIADDWADPDLPLHDNWRKEIVDAARFAPALGAELLWPIARLDETTCGATAVWFITQAGDGPHLARIAAILGAQRAFADARAELWRAPGRACR